MAAKETVDGRKSWFMALGMRTKQRITALREGKEGRNRRQYRRSGTWDEGCKLRSLHPSGSFGGHWGGFYPESLEQGGGILPQNQTKFVNHAFYQVTLIPVTNETQEEAPAEL